ncbi:DUF4360 domain-containing protein [Actinoplanes sp. NPDC051861]|uniref:DUF4360 domain-containing protein n=1 Tax=Actinoplanes sp. NPDC051861 TaxID=3155170 RepID=UPI00341F1433
MKEQSINKKRVAAAVLAAAVALPLGSPAYGAPEAAAKITVEVIANNGSGCAPGTASVVGNPDDTGFRVRYRNFVAKAGPDTSVLERRKNCQLSVLVTIPDGWTVAIASASYRGKAHLLAGASGLQRTSYYWQGSSESERKDLPLTGPLNGQWATWDVAPVLTYAPCDTQRVLNVNTELRVDAGDSTGANSLSMNTTEGDVDTLFNFSWSRC